MDKETEQLFRDFLKRASDDPYDVNKVVMARHEKKAEVFVDKRSGKRYIDVSAYFLEESENES